MRYVALFLMSVLSSQAVGAEFVVVPPGLSLKQYDKAQEAIAYVNGLGADSAAAPEGPLRDAILLAERYEDMIDDLGADPANGAKAAAISGLSDPNVCSAYLAEGLGPAPKCFATWTDSSFADCSTLNKCGQPGSALCNLVGGEYTRVQRNVAGTVCGAACQQPNYKARITCQ